MKRTISRISIRNFRALRNVDIRPDRVNLLIGPTGSGKTSLRAAVEYALTRRNHWTNGAGTGIATQVSHGAKAGSVLLLLSNHSGEGDLELLTEFPKESDSNQKRAAAFASLNLSETAIRSALRGSAILDVSDVERREILCETLGIDVRIETLIRRLNEWHEDLPDLGDWLDEQTARLGWAGRDYERFAAEQRTAANRVLKEARQRVEFLRARVLDEAGQENPPATATPETHERVRQARDEKLQQLAALTASEQPARDTYQAALREYRQLERTHEAARNDLERAQRDLQVAMDTIPLRPDRYATANEVREKQAKVDQKLTELLQQRELLVVDSWQFEGPCPPGTCHRVALVERQKRIAECDAEAATLRGYQERCRMAIGIAERFEAGLLHANELVERAEQEVTRAQERLAGLDPLPETQPQPPASRDVEIEQLRLDLAQFEYQMTVHENERAARQTWEREYVEFGEAAVRVEQLQNEATRWEAMVKALEPRGLAARLSEQAVQSWAAQVDASASRHFGMRFRVSLGDREWTLEGQAQGQSESAGGDGWTPLFQMSGGERLLLSACMQVALVRCTSLPVVFLDECQAADISRMKRLVKFLHASGVQGFLFAGSQNEVPGGGAFVRPHPIPVPGLTTWWVEAGNITPIKNTEEAAA